MNSFTQLIHKPKIVIPLVAIIALIVGVLFYGSVGRAPIVTLPTDTSLQNTGMSSAESVDIAFLQAGRIATVNVREGDHVQAGETLATLDSSTAVGALNQAKGALELAQAQYASLNVQYANAQKQQDVLVDNAHRVLLSSGLAAVAENKTGSAVQAVDDNQTPQISGTYNCDKTGSYEVDPYPSGGVTGYSFDVKGLETGSGAVTYYTPQPLGSCGLYILFPAGYIFDPKIKWVIDIPNTRSASYATNKNAYDLAVATRDQVLKQLEANLGKNGSSSANVAQATIDAAEGSYEIAAANLKNTIIIAPVSGTISFVDDHLKSGESAVPNKTVITITQ